MQSAQSSGRLIYRPDALEAGFDDSELRRLRASGQLRSVRRGAYVVVSDRATQCADPVDAHLLLAYAAHNRSPDLTISHASAAAIWGLPLWSVDLARAHLTRPPGGGARRTHDRHLHSAAIPSTEIRHFGDVTLTSVARTLVDLGRTEQVESVVVAADFALHERLVTPNELADQLRACSGLPGVAGARRGLLMADGRSESVGESRTRFALADFRLDAQVDVFDRAGRLVGRVDLGCAESALLVEFDGRVKYQRLLRPGQTAESAVYAEKLREDALRGLGYVVVRVTWADLDDRATLRRRVREASDLGRRLVRSGQRPAGQYVSRPRVGPTSTAPFAPLPVALHQLQPVQGQ